MSTTIHSLPLFPLEVVLYPGEHLPLHIFEERYKEMIGHCLAEDDAFGVLLSEDSNMAEVGCTARVERIIERYEDGQMDLLARGEERFRLLQLYQKESYLTADVEKLEEPDRPAPSDLQERLITQHMKLLEVVGRTVRPSIYENLPFLSYTLAQNAGLSLSQKQDVLELLTEEERIGYLVEHLEQLLPRLKEEGAIRRRIQSDGHFKDFPPEEL